MKPALAVVALAFGLTLLALVYAFAPVSGCHVNPAVTLGALVSGKVLIRDAVAYWIAQLVGGIAGAAVLFAIASGTAGFAPGGFASNGYDALSPGGYGLVAALLCEVVMTAMFLLIILGSTSKAAPAGFASPAFAPFGRVYRNSPLADRNPGLPVTLLTAGFQSTNLATASQ